MPATPGRDGYIFSGWYTEVDGEGSEFSAGTTVSEDITVYARWRLQYTITFDAAGGSPDTQTRTAADGSSLDSGMPPAPSWERYIFSGWYTEVEGGDSKFSADTPVTGNITVYARWSLDTSIQYTVTFDAAGGSPDTQTRTVTNGASLGSSGMPSAPTMNGYSFDGWYTEAQGGGSEFSADTTVSGNITVYARWSLDTSIQYTVTFDAEGGSPATQTRTVTNGASLGSSGMPSTPTRSGYNFSGWYTGVDGGGSEFTADTPVSADIRVYAWWKYMVTFDAEGGNPAIQTRTAANGDSLGFSGMPSAPTRSGYNFGGWYTTVNGGGSEFTAATTVSGNIRVYAWWTTYSYTVSFEKNGGDTEAVPATKTVTSPSVNVGTLPVPPTRTTYIFDGWYTGPDGGGNEFTAATVVTGDTTVYARWTGETYTVTFKSNYGANETLYTKTVTVPATTIADFPANPSRSGYTFGGWNTQADGGGSGFAASTAVSGSITVYAKWTGETYTVTFKGNYGANETLYTRMVTVPATTITGLPANPDRPGYNFGSWNTQAGGGGGEFTALTAVSDDMTVYAQWDTYSYIVTFNKNGGDTEAVPVAKTVASPATNVGMLPVSPSRTGYIFGGWYTQANGGGTSFTESTAVTGNITVYARWNTYSYTVTFNNSGGNTAANPAEKTVASPATNVGALPVSPTRTGYIFGGWYTQANGGGTSFTESTAVTGNITVYAKWNTYSYTVTFNNSGGNTAANPAAKTVASPETSIDALPAPPSRNGYSFDSWNTQANGGGTLFTASTTVSGNITVYAQWTNTIITLNPEDAGDGAFSQGTFTLSKNGDESQTVTITGSDYTNPRWFVDGELKGTGTGITIQAADHGAGGHNLTLLISKNGVSWSKAISFTVTN
jgi:uncharacterized repeat protein (TIGR02543 family)